MIAGQMKDMQAEGQPIDRESLEKMHAQKTGAMIIAAVASGAIIADADPDQLAHLRDYAGHVGLAFQVTDDILNVEGNPQLMGKARGTDQDRRKSTYPALLGMAASKAHAGTLIQSALNALAIFDNKADLLRAIAAYIIRRRR
jgi:geranylgeranyl diphosphate synthase type II